ncbi:MAG: single-stranded-DNA-specific exonuclease RecJ [Pirellulaceae bacterium]|nr:single-stranded-DNA-specific exonuclease RecJ [Pirellulaceae bacterium]
MQKRWRIQPHDSALISRMEHSANVPSVVAQLLSVRGMTQAPAATEFLEAKLSGLRDPELLPGLSQAADLIYEAVRDKRRIVVYGDYDADGMTATALLFRCLRMVGANVGYYVPNRMDEGYGLNDAALQRLASEGVSQIVSVDCGIASVDEAVTARELGLELIITDHHQMADRLPEAAAIVHPMLPGHDYPFKSLCGAGVAFKLAWAICQRVSKAKRVAEPFRNFLMTALGFAAIGTVADVVPLVDENRILVKHGLLSLKARPSIGVECLMRLTGVDKKSQLGSEDIGFSLAPRLNAAGRLGQAQLGVELLATENEERAKSLAEYINELNNNRLHLERSIYLSANKQVKERFAPDDDPALVLADRGWHQGVIGIVAGRLAEKYYRPVVMIALDELGGKPGTGSARSAAGLDLHHALAVCSEHLVKHGGHAAAAGLRIDEDKVDAFRAHFCEHVEQSLTAEARVAELNIDAETTFTEMTLGTVQQMERLAPFGQANPRPLLCTSDVNIQGEPKPMGKGDRHVTLTLEQYGVRLRAVAFNQPEWVQELSDNEGPLDVAFRPIINEFRGRRSVELQLVDWRPARELAQS